MALALSSTALALAPLTERGAMKTQGGQSVFAILLFQDIAVIPMLTILALMGTTSATTLSWTGGLYAVGVIAATLVGGHFLMRPVFRYVARMRQREIFTALALLLVIGIAGAYEKAGLSMALGSFLAGVLLAESEYRHEIEAAVEPFKGLLLGLFFVAVGMSVDFGLLFGKPLLILGIIVGLFALKSAVLWVIARAAKLPPGETPLFILLLAQGGEVAFVLLTLGVQQQVLPLETAQAVTLAVALSMLSTPFLLILHDRVILPRLKIDAPAKAEDTPEEGKVIVAGLGRIGQVVARILHGAGHEPTILDDDPDHVEQSRRFGFRVFYGDATRLDLLEAAGAARADFLIIALDDPAAISLLARTAVKHFPNLRIIARARDMRHMFELRDIGVELIERETFESALELSRAALSAITGDAERSKRAVKAFARHDNVVLSKLYAVHKSEQDIHVSVSNELRDQFAQTLREDEGAVAAEPRPGGNPPA
jgi:glutathione-regulated potassium-efflux system ancillary protein KefC